MEAEATWIGLEMDRHHKPPVSAAMLRWPPWSAWLPTEMADLVIESIEQTVVHVRSLKEGGTP